MTPANKPSANEAKLRQLILHIASLSDRDESFGAIKLNKLLFHADFTAYVLWGKPITGVPYFALENGPAPRPMKKNLRLMEEGGEIAIRKKNYFGYDQDRVIPLTSPNTDFFTKDEMQLVFHLIQEYWGQSGTSMSNESHDFLGWSAASLEEDIPYSVALVGTRQPTKDEIRRGLELQFMAEECLANNASRHHAGDNRGA
jgi:hypothetical protein